jgi:hypothetical protein
MNVKGSKISKNKTPDNKTNIENIRPKSLWNVISPNPKVI